MGNTMTSWDAVRDRLHRDGLTDIGVIDPAQLPVALARDAGVADVGTTTRLVLIAGSGQSLWQALTGDNPAVAGADPVDDYTTACVTREFDALFGPDQWTMRYPGPGPAPLMALGQWLGWSYPSPLGPGIHPEYGLWFAYRALIEVDAALKPDPPLAGTSTCESCATRDCETACPPGAVTTAGHFDIDRCIDFRDRNGSPCAQSCLARLACPAGASHRYTLAQLAYHQRRALDAMRRWRTP